MFTRTAPHAEKVTSVPGSTPAERPRKAAVSEGRPDFLKMVVAMLDAHISRVDYFDTPGGDEVIKLLRRARAHREKSHHEVPARAGAVGEQRSTVSAER